MTDKPLINRVANSGIKTIDLEKYYPKEPLVELDIKQFLFKELLLREKDFRMALKEIDWSQYQGKILLTFCSSDAIVPIWAYMLISSLAAPFAKTVFQGSMNEYLKNHYSSVLDKMDVESFKGDRVVIKGCSDKDVPPSAYAEVTKLLQPYAQSIMFGEPCSTVPIFKRPRELKKA